MNAIKITALSIQDFGNHEATTLDLAAGSAHVLIGDAYAGKSSVLNAVEAALTGRGRGFGPKAVSLFWDRVSRRGGRGARITATVKIGDAEPIEVKRTKNGVSPPQEVICKSIGVPDAEALHDLLTAGRFGKRPNDQRMRLVQRCLGGEITRQILIDAEVTDTDIQAAALNRSIKSGEAAAAEKRLVCQRAAKVARQAPLPIDEEIPLSGDTKMRLSAFDLEKLTAGIAKLQADRDRVHGEIRAAEGAVTGGRAVLEGQVAEAETTLADAKKTLDTATAKVEAFKKDPRTKAYKGWKTELDSLKAGESALDETGEALEAKKALADLRFSTAEAGLAKKVAGKCPTCGKKCSAEDFEAHWTEEKDAATRDLMAVASELEAHGKTVAAWEASIKDLSGKMKGYEDEVKAARAAVAAAQIGVDACIAELEETREALADAPAAAAPADTSAQKEDLSRMDGRLAAARERERKIRDFASAKRQYDKSETIAKEQDAEAARFAAMETALGETGIVAQMTKDPLQRLNAEVAIISGTVFRTPHEIVVADDCTILMDGIPVEEASCGSEGENYLANFAVAAALAYLSGIRFLLLDSMSNIAAVDRDLLIRAIWTLTKEGKLGQVIMVGGLRGKDGWCDGCGQMRVAGPDGLCAEPTEGGKCGTRIVLPRPAGPGGFLRRWSVVSGKIEEVLPVTPA